MSRWARSSSTRPGRRATGRAGQAQSSTASGHKPPAEDEAPDQPVERARPALGMLADDPMLLTGRAVVARRRLKQRLDQHRDLETENLGIALLGDAATHGADVVGVGRDSKVRTRAKSKACLSRSSVAQEASYGLNSPQQARLCKRSHRLRWHVEDQHFSGTPGSACQGRKRYPSSIAAGGAAVRHRTNCQRPRRLPSVLGKN
jgi:hypothetical protein